MHVVIMGCGRVGATLARALDERGHVVSVVDRDPAAFRRLGAAFGGRTVQGVGFDRTVLENAGTPGADAFAAVSSGDNSNIIAARVAREAFAVPRVVARIYDARRAEIFERLGIPTVATVPWAAERLLDLVVRDTPREHWSDPTGAVTLVPIRPVEAWAGHPISLLEGLTAGRAAVLVRFGVGAPVRPGALIHAEDEIFVAVPVDGVPAALAVAAAPPPEEDT